MSGELLPAIGDFPVGARISSYQIEQLIGRGGMASVYRAKDVRLDRQVALKVLAPELARDEAFRQRFIRESRSAASVDHPNIIPVFEAGESEGVLFIAMRYVTGQDVRALIESEGKLAPGRAVSIVTQVASALDAAHARGLIHRDVKPANMLLGSVGTASSPDHIYLSDFGLSKGAVSAQSLTGTGQFLGTIDYMSPEQIEGRPVDGRTDLYALACAAFEMLTGEPPFRREQNLAVMWAQVSAPPPSVRDLRPDLPLEVDQVLARALAKAPDDRQATCMEFATQLRSACAPAPGGVPQPGPGGPVPLAKPPGQGTELAFAPGSGAGPGAGDRQHPPTAAIGMPPVGGAGAAGYSGPGGYEPTITESAVGAATGPGSAQAGQADQAGYGAGPGPAGAGPGQYGGTPGQYGGSLGQGVPPGQTDRLWPASGGPSTYPGQAPPPRRGRLMPVLIGFLVVAILAGAGYGVLRLRSSTSTNSIPTPPPTTRTITHSPSTAPPTSPASSSAQPATPAEVVTAYYNAINNHDYPRAWRLNHYLHSSETYEQFKAGFAGTSYTTLTIVSVSGDTVSMRLAATQTDGTVKYFAGTYTVQNGEIVGASVQQTG